MEDEIKKPLELSWMDEKVTHVVNNNWMYRIICWFLGKKETKMSYKELYLLIYGLNKHRLGETQSKIYALAKIISIYKNLHNNKLPKMEKND